MLVWGAWRDALDRAVEAHRAAKGRLNSLLSSSGSPANGSPTGAAAAAVGAAEAVAAAASAVSAAVAPLATGWSGASWSELETAAPGLVDTTIDHPLRIGVVRATADVGVPLLVPFTSAGHVTIDSPVRDPRVAGLFQGVILRVLAGLPPGDVRIVVHDAAGLGSLLAPFRELVDAGVVADAGADRDSLLAALDDADAHVHATRHGSGPTHRLILALAGLPPGAGADVEARLVALAHAGPAWGLSLLLADWPPPRPAGQTAGPQLEAATRLHSRGRLWSPDLPGVGAGLDLPVELDPPPPAQLVDAVCRAVAERATVRRRVSFTELLVDPPWTHRSVDGLATPIGRATGTTDTLHVLRFDDTTPHWLIGGRSGSGKTVFLLDLLAGLAVRYPPSELELYLLDFKEGVSFTEFTPTRHDPTWMPHAVAVGVESDREYGLAVLRALREEMARRAAVFKELGVTSLSALRAAEPAAVAPRILAVVDEFQVLFAGNDDTARRAGELLEEIARKGRSFGVHLVLASQTAAGIEALQTKTEAIFGQFPMRIALAGGGTVLDPLNTAADTLTVGSAVLNASGGVPGANTLVRIPYADPAAMAGLRHELWRRRSAEAAPPAVFAGYAEQHLDDDPVYARLRPEVRRRYLLLGRAVDVGSPTAAVAVDAVPGRHLAVVGPSAAGGDVLHAALCGLARQHHPGGARFVIAPLATAGDAAAADAVHRLEAAGHTVQVVRLPQLGDLLGDLARFTDTSSERPTYLALFGAEAAGPALSVVSTETFRPGTDDLRAVVQSGPAQGVHMLGWWRSLSRLSADLGPTAREDVACLLALNVPGAELQTFLGRFDLHYDPRPHRGLLLDRHDDTARLIVPFVRGSDPPPVDVSPGQSADAIVPQGVRS